MASSKLISLVLLFVALHQCNSISQVCSFWKGVYYPAPWQSLIFDRNTFQGSKLLYAVCGSASFNGRSCSIVRDKDEPFLGGNYTCQIGMKASTRSAVLGDKVAVMPFGDDRAILAWTERTNSETKLGLTSVRLSDCSTHEVRSNVDHSFDDSVALDNLKLIPYQHTYDALFTNSRQCGDKYCKLSVDVEANTVTGPTPWFPLERYNQIIDLKPLDSDDKGAVAIETNSNENKILILQGNAKRVLKSYGSSGLTSVASATSNELIATCHLSDGTLNCAQYDQSGTLIVDSTNHVDSNVHVVAVHNLRGGAGLFVLLNNKSQARVHVLRLDIKGNQVGRIDVEKFECDQNLNDVAGQFWEKDDQYCVSLACYESDAASANKRDRGHLSATAKCFTLRDLKPVA